MQGVILGTAAYMSPEQARGRPVDKGTDIWAFGCVLFEMMTGHPTFAGRDVTEILAAVIRAEPDWNDLPANLHWRLKELIERCLEKEARNRYSGISDARVDIQKVLADPSGLFAPSDAIKKPGMGLRTILLWVLPIIIVGTAVWFLKPKPPAERPHTTRFYYELPDDQQFFLPYDTILAVSPDGRQFVYSTPGGLYLRSLDELETRLIPGTEGSPQRPFFSPDGEWIGYWSGVENQLKKIPISGGASVGLADVSGAGTYSWGNDGMIVYGQMLGGLLRVSENGGTPEFFLESENEGFLHPQILPDGESILFTNIATQPYTIMVQSLKTGERKQLFPGDTARYLTTGHLVYSIGSNLFARPFDPDKLEVTGGQVPIIEGVFKMGGASQYAVSDSGTLIYIPGILAGESLFVGQSTLVWVDRNGNEEPLAAPPNTYLFPRISPDGLRMAFAALDDDNLDIWVLDLVRNTSTRLTFDPALDLVPIWTADSKRVVFLSLREGEQMWLKAADGTGKPEPLGSFAQGVPFPSSWSDDGKTLIAMVHDNLNSILPSSSTLSLNFDIGALSAEGDTKAWLLLQDRYSESDPAVSPDGQWMAYTSNESGKNHVYVRPYPDMEGGRWQISTTGGQNPLWSPDGSELYYRNGDEVSYHPHSGWLDEGPPEGPLGYC
jgi:Tol biopolymer transport system component